eukprot:1137442-Pelagomonas_calceolata.AAC.11
MENVVPNCNHPAKNDVFKRCGVTACTRQTNSFEGCGITIFAKILGIWGGQEGPPGKFGAEKCSGAATSKGEDVQARLVVWRLMEMSDVRVYELNQLRYATINGLDEGNGRSKMRICDEHERQQCSPFLASVRYFPTIEKQKIFILEGTLGIL